MSKFLYLHCGGSTNTCCQSELHWWEPLLDFTKDWIVLWLWGFVFGGFPLPFLSLSMWMVSMRASHSSQRCASPFGDFFWGWKGGFSVPLLLWDCWPRCSLCGRPLRCHQGSHHTLFHTGHCGQAADSSNFWLDLHGHMWNVLIQIIACSTLPCPLYLFPRSWSCLPCLSAKKVFCLFGNWGRRARVADM